MIIHIVYIYIHRDISIHPYTYTYIYIYIEILDNIIHDITIVTTVEIHLLRLFRRSHRADEVGFSLTARDVPLRMGKSNIAIEHGHL